MRNFILFLPYRLEIFIESAQSMNLLSQFTSRMKVRTFSSAPKVTSTLLRRRECVDSRVCFLYNSIYLATQGIEAQLCC